MGAKGRNRIIILLFSVHLHAANAALQIAPILIIIYLYTAHNVIQTTQTAPHHRRATVSADTILFVHEILQWTFFSGETFTIKRYDLYRMVKRVVTQTSIKLRVKTK